MTIAVVRLPDGRKARIRVPDGMSMEEASVQLQQMYQTNPEAFQAPSPAPTEQPAAPVAAAPQQPAPEAAPQDPSMLSQAEQFMAKYVPPYGMTTGLLGAAQGQAPRTELEAYGSGFGRALRDMAVGARQGFNKLTGDEEQLAALNEQEAQSRQQWDQREEQFPLSAGAGKLAGMVGAPLAVAGALPAAAGGGAVGGAGLGLRALLGAGSGAAAGYSQPLTPEEEASGQRELGAGVGGVVGGAAPVVGAGIGKLANALRKVDAGDALQDFSARQLGATPERGASGLYSKITKSVDDQYNALRGKFKTLYDEVEKAAPSPVRLEASSRLSKEALSLPEEVSNGLSPTARRVAASLERGSTRTSPIVDRSGAPIEQAREVSFKDVRDTIRELRAASRALPYTDNGIQQSKRIDNIIERLDEDLASWGNSSDEAAQVLRAARQVDAQYADEVAPFSRKDSPVGKFRMGAEDEAAFDKAFMRPDRGQAATELMQRVPETSGPLRELYGQQLTTPRGPVATRRALESGTLREALLSKSEREYLEKVSKSIGDSQSRGPLHLTLSGILRGVGAGKLDKMMHGVERYGQSPKRSTIIADMLRAYGAGQAFSED